MQHVCGKVLKTCLPRAGEVNAATLFSKDGLRYATEAELEANRKRKAEAAAAAAAASKR